MRRPFDLLAFAVWFASAPVHAQAGKPPVVTTTAATNDEQSMAFRDAAQDRMTVPVRIGPAGPFGFVIDTGAERSVVSSELARSLALPPGPNVRLFDFTGPSVVATVTVPALSVSQFGAVMMTAPALASGNLGAPGILGIDVLQGRKVVIDFSRNRMTLTSAKRASGDTVVRAESRAGQLIITDAEFYGRPIAVIIDTGSWISVGNRAMLALAQRTPQPFRAIQVTSVTGRSFRADLVTVDRLRIGGVNLDNFGLAFADVPPFERFGLKNTPALILGMSSLRLFRRVELDFANRKIGFSLPQPPIDFSSACRDPASPCRTY